MQVHLAGFANNNSDAIIVIQCRCGSTYMLDQAGGFPAQRLFVYRHGVPVKNLRCALPGSKALGRLAQGRPLCRERYRITLHGDRHPPQADVAHLTPRPHDQVLESSIVEFPPKVVGAQGPINPPPSTPYVNQPYDD
jgi:hypothetical protein